MAIIGTLAGEFHLRSEGGSLKVWTQSDGRVVVMGSEPMRRTRWYRDMLKAARECIRRQRPPVGFKIGGTEPPENRQWYLKMIEAGLDVIRQYENPALAYDGPKPNDVLKAVKSPYRVSNG